MTTIKDVDSALDLIESFYPSRLIPSKVRFGPPSSLRAQVSGPGELLEPRSRQAIRAS